MIDYKRALTFTDRLKNKELGDIINNSGKIEQINEMTTTQNND